MDQIIPKLRQEEVEPGKGKKVPEICKTLDISEKALQKENARLKELVADQALDMEVLGRTATSSHLMASYVTSS